MQQDIVTLCEIQATYKPKKSFNKPIVRSSEDIYALKSSIYKNGCSYKEEAFVLPLDNRNRVLGVCKVAEGGLTVTVVDVRVVFQHLLLANAVAFVLIHNHPSGNLKPSQLDDKLTAKMQKAAEVMDIKFVDHLIFTDFDGYFSYCDQMKL